jgi:hypothetical protein
LINHHIPYAVIRLPRAQPRILPEKMKTIARVLCLLVLAVSVCRSDAAERGDSTVPQPKTPKSVQTYTVRVVDFADSGHHLLIWNITFQTRDGDRVTCQCANTAGFVAYAGLDKLKPHELDRWTDFSDLPLFRIEIELGPTVGLRQPRPIGRLIRWERTKQ